MNAILRAAQVLAIIGGLIAGDVATAQTRTRRDVTGELQQAIPRLMTEGEVPGLQIALIRGGKVDWIKSFGVRNAETGGPVTDDTIFEAASLSKPVFAYAVMKLVEAGL